MPLWIRSAGVSALLLVFGPKLLTVAREVTASREAFTTSRAREGLWGTRVRSGAPTRMLVLTLRIRELLLLAVRVLWWVRNVIAVIEHGHGRLHL
jgi:hypothetical protein